MFFESQDPLHLQERLEFSRIKAMYRDKLHLKQSTVSEQEDLYCHTAFHPLSAVTVS